MSTTNNPIDVIASRHRELREALARIEKAASTLETERARLHALEAAVAPAELRDRTALGQAVVDGRKEPAREANELRRQVEEQRLRVDAVQQALELANAGVAETVADHREWFRQQLREAAHAGAEYRASISTMEAARDRLSDETGALAWLLDPEGGIPSPTNAVLGGKSGGLSMPQVMAALAADADAIDAWLVDRDEPHAKPRLELARRVS